MNNASYARSNSAPLFTRGCSRRPRARAKNRKRNQRAIMVRVDARDPTMRNARARAITAARSRRAIRPANAQNYMTNLPTSLRRRTRIRRARRASKAFTEHKTSMSAGKLAA